MCKKGDPFRRFTSPYLLSNTSLSAMIPTGKPENCVFHIGSNHVTNPIYPGYPMSTEDSGFSYVTLKPCVCCGMNEFRSDSVIPAQTVAASGLTEEDIRSVMREVSAALARRTSCCWKWGWLGPIMLIIWWLDIFTNANCGCSLNQSVMFCYILSM